MGENLLRYETSPYLLQHKDNPVHWRPWGEAAFEDARRENKPVLLSVGYSACHWCHVMAHESFEDPQIAGLMNELFVNIKVDREERPDVDQIYMAGLQALGGRGGWPLTAFLTPSRDLYWGGTYFPPTARFGRIGFPDVLRQVEKAYRDSPDRIAQNAARAADAASAAAPQGGALSPSLLDETALGLYSELDAENGGLTGAPKFPQASLLEFLWRAGDRLQDPRFRDAALLALDRICQGGIFDHLGGGFARYCVDERWLVPHFEKMLYDNAQLITLLTWAWKAVKRDLFKLRVEQTVAWIEREMRTPGGAFAASVNADSQGVEGKYYVWTIEEIEAELGAQDAADFCAAYGATQQGNWEGVNILNRLRRPPRDDADEEPRLAPLRAKLFAARMRRIPPSRDDKVLADWNGLAIEALSGAALAFGRPEWLEFAQAAYDFVMTDMARGDRIGHSARLGRVSHPGLSSDAIAMIGAALSLLEATGNSRYLQDAIRMSAALDAYHFDARVGYCLTASDATDLRQRPSGARDDATPNPNASAARNCVRLGLMSGATERLEQAQRLFDIFAGSVCARPQWSLGLLNAFDLAARSTEVVIVGPAERSQPLIEAAFAADALNLTVLRVASPQDAPKDSPAFGRPMLEGAPTAYVCRAGVCSLPITSAALLSDALTTDRATG